MRERTSVSGRSDHVYGSAKFPTAGSYRSFKKNFDYFVNEEDLVVTAVFCDPIPEEDYGQIWSNKAIAGAVKRVKTSFPPCKNGYSVLKVGKNVVGGLVVSINVKYRAKGTAREESLVW